MSDPFGQAEAAAREYWISIIQTRIEALDTPTSWNDTESSGLARSSLASEIHGMECAISIAKSRLNNMTSVSRLPPELLTRIFTFLAPMDRPNILESATRKDEPRVVVKIGWLSITHVCRRWRAAALNQACLWTRIPFRLGPSWVAVFAERAQSSPLVVQITGETDCTMWDNKKHMFVFAIQMIEQHLSHIEEIDLRFPLFPDTRNDAQDWFWGPLAETLTAPAPALRAISFYGREHFSLPEGFLSNAPGVTSLILFRSDNTWTFSGTGLHNLTSLNITSSSRPMAYELLIGLLRRTKFLESLRLDSALTVPALDLEIGHTVDMPCLEELCLNSGSDAAYRCLLQAIYIPRISKLQIGLKVSESVDDCITLIRRLATFMDNNALRALKITDGVPTTYAVNVAEIEAWRHIEHEPNGHPSFETPISPGNAALSLIVEVPNNDSGRIEMKRNMRKNVLQAFFQHFTLSGVQLVGLRVEQNFTEEGRLSLQQLPSVRYLGIASTALGSAPYLLSVFEHLSFLRLSSRQLYRPDMVIPIRAIINALRRRKDNGTPLPSLCLDSRDITSDVLADLNQLVPSVFVDTNRSSLI